MPETRTRPQRAAALKRKYKEDELFSEADDDVSEPEVLQKKVQRPKKKVIDSPAYVIADTSSKRRRKNLSKFLGMPLDLLYEIFSALHPKDILSLSRATRIFRETLESPNVCGVWRSAMDQDGAPPCPSDWTEQRWAALLYDHNCQTCMAKNVQRDYYARRRLCSRCRKKVVVAPHKVRKSHWLHDDVQQIMSMTPVTPDPPSGGSSRTKRFWHITDLELTDRALARLKADKTALEAWMKKQSNLIEEIRELAVECNGWERKKSGQRREEGHQIAQQRQQDTKERLKALGYSSDDFDGVKYNSEVRRTTPLTERSWNMIKTNLIALIEVLREGKLRKALQERHAERRLIVDRIYQGYKAQRTALECCLLPYTIELCLGPGLKERIEAGLEVEVTPEAFSDVEEHLPELILAVKEMVKQEAQVTFAQSRPGTNEPIDLNLATSGLQCMTCKGVMFGRSEIEEHHCMARSTGLSYSVYQQDLPTFGQNAMYLLPTETLIHQVIALAGLDPATATIADMDAADMSYFCPHCLAKYVPSGLKYYYSWRSIIHHYLIGIEMGKSCKIEIAAAGVLDHLRDLRAGSQVMNNSCIWYCNHCPPSDSHGKVKTDCVAHLSTVHQVQEPKMDVDIFCFNPYLRHNTDSVIVPRDKPLAEQEYLTP